MHLHIVEKIVMAMFSCEDILSLTVFIICVSDTFTYFWCDLIVTVCA